MEVGSEKELKKVILLDDGNILPIDDIGLLAKVDLSTQLLLGPGGNPVEAEGLALKAYLKNSKIMADYFLHNNEPAIDLAISTYLEHVNSVSAKLPTEEESDGLT